MITAEQLAFVLLPPLLMVGSGIVATFRAPGPALRGGILHLAAGVVFAVVAVELIPDLLRDHQPLLTVIGFAIGVAVMLGLRSLTHAKEEHDEEERKSIPPGAAVSSRFPWGMLAGVAIDLAVDGLMIGVGFAAGAKEGRLLAGALAVELISLGLAVAASLSKIGVRRRRSIQVLAGLSTTFIVGACVGVVLLGNLSSHALAGVLAFGAAALMFLVTEELLTEAHEEKETPLLTATFFAGFLAFLILGMVA